MAGRLQRTLATLTQQLADRGLVIDDSAIWPLVELGSRTSAQLAKSPAPLSGMRTAVDRAINAEDIPGLAVALDNVAKALEAVSPQAYGVYFLAETKVIGEISQGVKQQLDAAATPAPSPAPGPAPAPQLPAPGTTPSDEYPSDDIDVPIDAPTTTQPAGAPSAAADGAPWGESLMSKWWFWLAALGVIAIGATIFGVFSGGRDDDDDQEEEYTDKNGRPLRGRALSQAKQAKRAKSN